MRVKWIQPKEKGKTEKDQMEIKRGGCGRVSEKWREGKESDASAVGTGEVMRRGEEIFFSSSFCRTSFSFSSPLR